MYIHTYVYMHRYACTCMHILALVPNACITAPELVHMYTHAASLLVSLSFLLSFSFSVSLSYARTDTQTQTQSICKTKYMTKSKQDLPVF